MITFGASSVLRVAPLLVSLQLGLRSWTGAGRASRDGLRQEPTGIQAGVRQQKRERSCSATSCCSSYAASVVLPQR